jgi:hypothetical protein
LALQACSTGEEIPTAHVASLVAKPVSDKMAHGSNGIASAVQKVREAANVVASKPATLPGVSVRSDSVISDPPTIPG